ncbi:MAG: hypothetical protein QM500_01000 [Methylococcales bacterium]
MITIYSQTGDYAAELVRAGFMRAFTDAQVSEVITDGVYIRSSIQVFVNPSSDDIKLISLAFDVFSKVIVLGSLPDNFATLLSLSVQGLSDEIVEAGKCMPAPLHGFSESDACIQYLSLPSGIQCAIENRPFLRYDFAEEWNNLGYGAVRTDSSIWAMSCRAEINNTELTTDLAVVRMGQTQCSSYVTLTSLAKTEILWVNRSVGFVDSHEFRLLETFICNYSSEKHPCLPVLREIPYGYDAMVTMRLDCDESIKSATSLFELYQQNDVPFSLALRTEQDTGDEDYALLRNIIDNGGSVLSHTVNHKKNWGVDKEDVRIEARDSRNWIEKHVPSAGSIEYAVSPFHQNPDYAVEALSAEGYKGFISGIICNDPQYLISRAGKLYNAGEIISHSQQCMLHGDCMLSVEYDPIAIYKRSVNACIQSGAIFGYLDHPFSERYQYGWESEKQRLDIHQSWLDYLKSRGNVLFDNEVNTLNFIRKKSGAKIWLEKAVVRFSIASDLQYDLAFEYKEKIGKVSSSE